jgi:hypothetical protein
MKFRVAREPELFETRIRTRFLLTPLKLENEIRWLEKATYKEYFFVEWIPIRWIDDENSVS